MACEFGYHRLLLSACSQKLVGHRDQPLQLTEASGVLNLPTKLAGYFAKKSCLTFGDTCLTAHDIVLAVMTLRLRWALKFAIT